MKIGSLPVPWSFNFEGKRRGRVGSVPGSNPALALFYLALTSLDRFVSTDARLLKGLHFDVVNFLQFFYYVHYSLNLKLHLYLTIPQLCSEKALGTRILIYSLIQATPGVSKMLEPFNHRFTLSSPKLDWSYPLNICSAPIYSKLEFQHSDWLLLVIWLFSSSKNPFFAQSKRIYLAWFALKLHGLAYF